MYSRIIIKHYSKSINKDIIKCINKSIQKKIELKQFEARRLDLENRYSQCGLTQYIDFNKSKVKSKVKYTIKMPKENSCKEY